MEQMNIDKLKARYFLKQPKKLDLMIKNKLIEKAQWQDIAKGTTSSSQSVKINGVLHNMEKVQSSGSQQKMADAIDRFVDMEREIDEIVDKLIDTKKDVISVIEQLKEIEYDVLHKIYIQYLTFDDVADAYNKTYSWVTTVHGRALKNVQRILNQRKDIFGHG